MTITHPYSTPHDLALFGALVAQLVRQGLTFDAKVNTDAGTATVTMTGGF
jgi:hypothetical protein